MKIKTCIQLILLFVAVTKCNFAANESYQIVEFDSLMKERYLFDGKDVAVEGYAANLGDILFVLYEDESRIEEKIGAINILHPAIFVMEAFYTGDKPSVRACDDLLVRIYGRLYVDVDTSLVYFSKVDKIEKIDSLGGGSNLDENLAVTCYENPEVLEQTERL